MRARRWNLFWVALLLAGIAILVFAPTLDDVPRERPEVATDAPAAHEALSLEPAAAHGEATSKLPEPAASDAQAERTRVVPAEAREPARTTRVLGRVVDSFGKPIGAALVIAAPWPSDPSLAALRAAGGSPLDRARLSHLPLDLAGAAGLGLDIGHQARTDVQGRFELATLPPGRFRLAIRTGLHAPFDRNDLLLAAGDELALGAIALEPGIVLAGTVRDDAGPVAGALLSRVDDFGDPALALLAPALAARVATCDESGRFFTSAFARGRWRVLVTAPDHVERIVEGAGPDRELAIVLELGARLRGDVLADKVDFERLVVWARPASAEPGPLAVEARADARHARLVLGSGFTLEHLHAGRVYDLRVVSATQRFEDESPWSPGQFATPDRRTRARLVYRADASLVFDLLAPGGRERIGAFEVAIDGATPARASFADPQTPRRIGGVRPLARAARGRDGAQVSVLAPGFARFEQEVVLLPGLESGLGTLTLEPLIQVEVVVHDGASGGVLAGAEVRASEGVEGRTSDLASALAHTDGNGIARLTSLGARDSAILVRAAGRATLRIAGPFYAEGSAGGARLEAVLERGVEARVRIVDLAGHPLAGALLEHIEGEWTPNDGLAGDRARLRPDQGPGALAISDRDGMCVLRGLARGIHVFRVVRARQALDGEWSLIEVGREAQIDVLLATEAHARLVVDVDIGGEPLVGARVTLITQTPALASRAFLEAGEPLPEGVDARSGKDGSFALANLLPGVHHLVVEVPDQGVRALRTMRLGPGENRLRLDLGGDTHRIAGRIVDTESAAIAGAEVFLLTRDDEDRLAQITADAARPEEFRAFAQRFPATLDAPAARTAADGTFAIRGVARGPQLELFATDARGRFAIVRDLDVAGALEITLDPGGTLRVVTADSRLGLRHRVAAAALDGSAPPRIARTLPGLPVVWNALAPGDWSVQMWSEDPQGRVLPAGRAQTVTIVAGATTLIETTLP